MGIPDTKVFSIAAKGFSRFIESNTPDVFCFEFRNSFINQFGNLEVRKGIEEFIDVNIQDNIETLHEFVDSTGTTKLLCTSVGQIFLYDTAIENTVLVYTFPTRTETIYSYTMGNRIIFFNGVDRNVFTSDGKAFSEIRSILESGRSTAGTSANGLADSTVVNWTVTNVTQYDLVYYTTLSAYGLVTSVVSARVNHTPISAGGTGLGIAVEPSANDPYQIIDMIELNGIPVSGTNDFDNEGILVTGSTTALAVIRNVSSHNDLNARNNDIIYNVTKNRVAFITNISAGALHHTNINTQAVGDEIVLLKSSMPITSEAHVHFNRAYLVDSRDKTKIRISGPNNPFNMGGTGAGTLDIAQLQPKGEIINALHSFQIFLAIGTTRNTYFYEGTVPVEVSGDSKDFKPKGSIPYGILSKKGLSSIGNEIILISNNGFKSATLEKTSSQIIVKNISFQLDKDLPRILINTNNKKLAIAHYPRRSWILIKVGEELYVYNYSMSVLESTERPFEESSAWHLYDGEFAQQNDFLIQENGDLITAGLGGKINKFDYTFSDLGAPIRFQYETAWINPDKRQQEQILSKISRKKGTAIKPYFESGDRIPVHIIAEAPLEQTSKDDVIVTAGTKDSIGIAQVGIAKVGGTKTREDKFPLRWNGEEVKFSFNANVVTGPLVMGPFVVFYTILDHE